MKKSTALVLSMMLFLLFGCGANNRSEQIEAASQKLQQAQLAYSWFTGHYNTETLKIDDQDSFELGGYVFYKVDLLVTQGGETTTLADLSALESHLADLFDEHTVRQLMEKRVDGRPLYLYIEKDGRLYRFGGYVGQVPNESITATVTDVKSSGNTQTVSTRLTGTLFETAYDLEYDYYLTEVGEGKTVFTNFQHPIDVCFESKR